MWKNIPHPWQPGQLNYTTAYMSSNTINKSETEMTEMLSFGIAVDEPRISYTDGGCSNLYTHFGKL